MPVHSSYRVVAIDGPAASGKSSVARMLAARLGFVYVNTGAMYRAVTWLALSQPQPSTEPADLLRLLERTDFRCVLSEGASSFLLNGVDPAEELQAEWVNANVSRVAAVPSVRALLVNLQRQTAKNQSVVMEGRDIGSVVFPDSPYKFYIDASPEVRERRRIKQGFKDQIADRDRVDRNRAESPLTIPAGAVVIDSSDLTVEGTVDVLLGKLREMGVSVESAAAVR
jgi:cytidylate kinase